MPIGTVVLLGTFDPFLTNLMEESTEMGLVCFMFVKKVVIVSTRTFKTLSCRKVNLPCLSAVLQAPKMCEVVQTDLLQRKQHFLW